MSNFKTASGKEVSLASSENLSLMDESFRINEKKQDTMIAHCIMTNWRVIEQFFDEERVISLAPPEESSTEE